MTKNPYPLFLVSQTDSPKQIEKRIGVLIRLYSTDHQSIIAHAIVDHLNAILARPGFVKNIDRRCLYLRLVAHWRCLAWIDREHSDFLNIQ